MPRDEPAWSRQDIHEQYRMATPVIRKLQEILADAPGEEVLAEDIASRLDKSRAQLAGAVGAYSGHVYRRWGRYMWPFSVRREHGQTYYSMPRLAAEVIQSAAKEPSEG